MLQRITSRTLLVLPTDEATHRLLRYVNCLRSPCCEYDIHKHLIVAQSMLLGGATRRPQPLFDIASSLSDMKARVAGIPVYTVANKADEFVLVTGGEVSSFVTCSCIILSATVQLSNNGCVYRMETKSSWDSFSLLNQMLRPL